MEYLNIQYLTLALLGVIIHIAIKITNRTDKTEKFSLKVWCDDRINWARAIISIASTLAILMMAPDIANVMGITLTDGAPALGILAFLAGYLNHSMIRNLLKMFKKKQGIEENK